MRLVEEVAFLIKKKNPTGSNLLVRDKMFYQFADKISYIVGILKLFTVAISYEFLFWKTLKNDFCEIFLRSLNYVFVKYVALKKNIFNTVNATHVISFFGGGG